MSDDAPYDESIAGAPDGIVRPGGHSLRIEVPDAASGFMLVHRLGEGCALSGSDARGWIVAGSADGNLPQTLAAVQQWLNDEAIDRVTIHVGDHTHSMTRG